MDIFGSENDETLRPTGSNQRVLGLGGRDILQLGSGLEAIVLVGGAGRDTYSITGNLSNTNYILENGNDSGDHFNDNGFLKNTNIMALIDERHLFIANTITGAGLIFVDWQLPENKIETWTLSFDAFALVSDMPFSFFKSFLEQSRLYVGNISFDILGTEFASAARNEIDLMILAANSASNPASARDIARQMLVGDRVVTPQVADGSFGLHWVLITDEKNDVVIGTTGNDFINSVAGADAINGGAGHDILDGGSGSNFLTGGAGTDYFFVDGRGADGAAGRTVWSTITDMTFGQDAMVTIWGWQAGTSRLVSTVIDGAAGFRGATWHLDLTGDSIIDASVTLAGIPVNSVLAVPGISVSGDGYLQIA